LTLPAETLEQAQQRLGYSFTNRALLEQALTHASVADGRVRSNERLEFLGDAVLGLIVCQRIFELHPTLLEGEMTKVKSSVVSRQACAVVAQGLRLAELLALGKGMRIHETIPTSLAAAVLESVVAAIYLDGGLEPARRLLVPLVDPLIEKAFASGHQENFKSILQQHAQQKMDESPVYVVLGQRGPDHAKHFQVCVQIGTKRFVPCWGNSKKVAEQQAALAALQELGLLAPNEQGELRLTPGSSTNGSGSAGAVAGGGLAGGGGSGGVGGGSAQNPPSAPAA
jgi:ribonuclease III